MYKIFRVGHRNFNKNGVITIASKVDIESKKIWYGVSFCNPKEKKYYKSMGNKLAIANLEEKISNENSIKLHEAIHSDIIKSILYNLLGSPNLPKWAPILISNQLDYPTGLHRYNSKNLQQIDFEIVANSEYAKEQLLLALEYIHYLQNFDTDYVAVDRLAHVYFNPELITVKV